MAEANEKKLAVVKAKKRPRLEAERLDEMVAALTKIGAAAYMAGDRSKAEDCTVAIAAVQKCARATNKS
jgi:hypothetical protein